jgi:hypothetical protein
MRLFLATAIHMREHARIQDKSTKRSTFISRVNGIPWGSYSEGGGTSGRGGIGI